MNKFDVVLQGPFYPFTGEIIKQWSKFDFVDNVIISCWEEDKVMAFTNYDVNSKYVFNKDVDCPGIQNINRQIFSSYSGICKAKNDYVIKSRTDFLWDDESIIAMYNFFNENKEKDLSRIDDISKPFNKIFVIGHCKKWAIGSIDFIYWGHRSDLIDFFNIPFYTADYIGRYGDFNKHLRPEQYTTLNYISKFDKRVQNMFFNQSEYIYDNAPKRNEAIAIFNQIATRILKPFKLRDLKFFDYKRNRYWPFDETIRCEGLWGHDEESNII